MFKKVVLVILVMSFAFIVLKPQKSKADAGIGAVVVIETIFTVYKVGDKLVEWISGNFYHNWVYCDYSSGHRVYNRFKNKRSGWDIHNYFANHGDNHSWYIDNDWGAVHVCLKPRNCSGSDKGWLGTPVEINRIDHPPEGYWVKEGRPSPCGCNHSSSRRRNTKKYEGNPKW